MAGLATAMLHCGAWVAISHGDPPKPAPDAVEWIAIEPPPKLDEAATVETATVEPAEPNENAAEPLPSPTALEPSSLDERPSEPNEAPRDVSSSAPPAPMGGELLEGDGGVPFDMTGVTLGGGPLDVAGSTGPSQNRDSASAGAARGDDAPAKERSATSSPKGPVVVALADLSKPPSPPNLNGALRALYPDDMRAEGRRGSADVRALIGPDGRVMQAEVNRASHGSFASACQALLRGSTWTPPVDRQGAPVSTWVRYTCRFEVER